MLLPTKGWSNMNLVEIIDALNHKAEEMRGREEPPSLQQMIDDSRTLSTITDPKDIFSAPLDEAGRTGLRNAILRTWFDFSNRYAAFMNILPSSNGDDLGYWDDIPEDPDEDLDPFFVKYEDLQP